MHRQRRIVRTWLARHDRTQRWLAQRLGISQSQLSLVLAGKRTLTDDLAQKFATTTGLRLRAAAANKAA
jgi:antitoxin component HigA of HigAB toxin-antitoxin module